MNNFCTKGRYARQIILPEIDEAGQSKLLAASVLLVGVGGLGSPIALYLAAAGVGHITIADADEVRLNNLNRQILYNESDLGHLKVDQARKKLEKFNNDIDIKIVGRINESTLSEVLESKEYSVVIDGTDNFETRYLINDACINAELPYVYGSVLGWQGQVSVFEAKKGPCYRCIYPEAPLREESPTCGEAGVIGVSTGCIGILEAAEAVKLIIGKGTVLWGKMLIADLFNAEFRTVQLSKDPKCISCR